ncbi:MAG: hypothetical protein OXE92_03005 [Bacteroidetes bacterium]|nr:hypothetical protein [Bacteroidota bacterium]MCY4204677.1 hypothetical protein [Bacteroidota bacterium]
MKPSKPKIKRDLSELYAEFDEAMHTPSVNLRYEGMTPIEFLQRTASIEQNQKLKNQSLCAEQLIDAVKYIITKKYGKSRRILVLEESPVLKSSLMGT